MRAPCHCHAPRLAEGLAAWPWFVHAAPGLVSDNAVAIACDSCLVATLCWCFVLRFEVLTDTLGSRLNQHTSEGLRPTRNLAQPWPLLNRDPTPTLALLARDWNSTTTAMLAYRELLRRR